MPEKTERSALADLAGAVLIRGGMILLGKRKLSKRTAPGCWDLFGGRVEFGETFEEACIRELQEELDVAAELDGELDRVDLPSGVQYRIFLVTRFAGEPRCANDEHDEIRWFRLDEAIGLDCLASPHYRALFNRCLSAV